jgi:hypothetical protein
LTLSAGFVLQAGTSLFTVASAEAENRVDRLEGVFQADLLPSSYVRP